MCRQLQCACYFWSDILFAMNRICQNCTVVDACTYQLTIPFSSWWGTYIFFFVIPQRVNKARVGREAPLLPSLIPPVKPRGAVAAARRLGSVFTNIMPRFMAPSVSITRPYWSVHTSPSSQSRPGISSNDGLTRVKITLPKSWLKWRYSPTASTVLLLIDLMSYPETPGNYLTAELTVVTYNQGILKTEYQ